MKRNCNLELRLVTPSDHDHHYNLSMVDPTAGGSRNDEKQKLTIFYNGRIAAACDATELQARAIIRLASGEVEDEKRKNNLVSAGVEGMYSGATPASGLSMKRSLQRFLQKRKVRAQSFSPYTITHHPHNKN